MASGHAGAAVALHVVGTTVENLNLLLSATAHLDAAWVSVPFAGRFKPGFLDGFAGLLWAAHTLDPELKGHKRLAQHLRTRLINTTHRLSFECASRDGMPTAIFDVVSGLAGIGRVALALATSEDDILLCLCADALASLFNDAAQRPRWWTPRSQNPDRALAARFPDGCLNLGMAHGLAGVVSFLSLCVLGGFSTPQRLSALACASKRLRDSHVLIGNRITWDSAAAVTPKVRENTEAKKAWCYGSPGVCAALLSASLALGDSELGGFSAQSLMSSSQLALEEWRLFDAGLCHGWSGTALVWRRFLDGRWIEERLFDAVIRRLATELDAKETEDWRPGFLEGELGAAMAAVSISSGTNRTVERWLLLS